MAGIEEVKADVQRWAERAQQAIGPLQQAHDILEEARAGMVSAAQESAQESAHHAIALLGKAMTEIIDGQHTITAAAETAQGYSTTI